MMIKSPLLLLNRSSESDSSEILDWRMRAIEAAGEGIVITDPKRPDNPIIYVNEGFRKITGYSNAEVLGQNCRFMRGPETNPATTAEIRKKLRMGQPVTCEILNYRKSRESFWNKLFITPVFDQAGQLTQFVGIQLDITDLKRAEEAAEGARARLAETARFEALGQLASGLAHEINNPTTGVLLLSGRLRRMLGQWQENPPGSEELKSAGEMLSKIENLCTRVAKIVGGMQAFAVLPHTDGPNSDRAGCILGSALDGAFAEYHEAIEKRGLNIRLRGSRSLGVAAEWHLLSQVFGILLSNSLDATAELEEKQLFIDIFSSGPTVAIRFVDSAPPIPKDHVHQLFMPFFTTKEQGKGTGLGLYVARSICERLGAQIFFETEGERNVFVVVVKAQKTQGSEQSRPEFAMVKETPSDLRSKT